MPRILENKLKKEYGEKSDIPYKIMNKLGDMHGNKETKKGKKIEKKLESRKHEHSRNQAEWDADEHKASKIGGRRDN